MKYSTDVVFEHAVDLAMKEFRYQTRDEVEFAMYDRLKKVAHSDKISVYYTTDNIMKVLDLWNIEWTHIEDKLEHDRCNCGAKHTSFPKSHYDWCDVFKPKRKIGFQFNGFGEEIVW